MALWSSITSVYLASVVVALILTYGEQKRRGQNKPFDVVMGYLLCMVWPLVAFIVLIFYKPNQA
ncbi:hypothetical protein SAMN05421759_11380 [Roseivivax lentus]|uniref:Uncharacterized protein n=1 Tax=Roseivivax lentus TaxID=633194 RepID=A0A1N7P8S0_9RHOB|nr:hypothetical protein SAMN05421759_11380 [Roseivivax lentus]